MEPEIQEVVRHLFSRRLAQFGAQLGARDEDETTMAPSSRVAARGDVFRRHAQRVLRDYVSLLELFDAVRAGDSVEETFESHIDEIASALLSALGATGHAERNRVANEAASIKASARAELEEWLARIQRETEHPATEPNELDDRLPLGRRGAFDRDLERQVSDACRDALPFALVMMDIDHFKRVNDQHGHPIGDEVLFEVAKLVVARSAHKGAAYRYGGEEFALLLPGYSAEEAAGLAERLRKDIEEAVVSSKSLRVTASFGAASMPDHGSGAKDVLTRADEALYEAKRGGRNRVSTPGELSAAASGTR